MFQQMELALGDAPRKRRPVVTKKAAITEVGTKRAEAKAAFVLGLRARGINDLSVLRALEKVPREIFVPHRFGDLAGRDLCLPIGCGQTLSEPFLVARMIEILALEPHHRVLEVGTGSGYATAILAEIAREVISLERFQTLAIEARVKLERLGLSNATVIFGDGLALSREAGRFDRILVHGRLDDVPEALVDVLAESGLMVMAKPDPAVGWRQILVELARCGESLIEQCRGACRLQAMIPGLARVL